MVPVIDKSGFLEKGMEEFPSLYVEGAAASGKSEAVAQLLKHHPEQKYQLFWMKREVDDPEGFFQKLHRCRHEMKKEPVWIILEECPPVFPDEIGDFLVEYIKQLPEHSHMIMVGRERLAKPFLELLWNGKLEILSQKNWIFSKEEVSSLVEAMGNPVDAQELYEVTGGWPGCVCLMLRMATPGVSPQELRDRYEVEQYIQDQILNTLERKEKEAVYMARICPWINEALFLETEILNELEKKGILWYLKSKKQWKIAPLLLDVQGKLQSKISPLEWKKLGIWYGKHGYQEEMAGCFQKIPEVIASWDEKTPQACFFRGMYYKEMQDQQGLEREEKNLECLLTDKKTLISKDLVEVYLNLCYVDVSHSLTEWLCLVETYGELLSEKGNLRLYSLTQTECSCLSGVRELSELFACSKKEEHRQARIWKTYFRENEWEFYRLARLEYYVEVEREDVLPEEDWLLFLEKREEYNQYASCLLKKMQFRTYDEERQALLDSLPEASHSPVKELLLLGQYKKAEKQLKLMIPYLKQQHNLRYLSEALFQQAMVYQNQNQHGKALRSTIESFLINGVCRYVGFYTEYGRVGRELLEQYVDWMKKNSPEGWHRKKKYNYGNVLRMPEADYLEYLIRRAKQQERRHPETLFQTQGERLTMMETVVLQRIRQGMSNAEICEALNLKLPTVKSHIYNLYRKLGVNSRSQVMLMDKNEKKQ